MSEQKTTMKQQRKADCNNAMEQMISAPCVEGMIRAIYNRGWKDGTKAMDSGREEAYQDGLDKAWGVAKEIALVPEDGGLSALDLYDIFEDDDEHNILMCYTPAEAIQRIADWKLKKKQEELEAEEEKKEKPHWIPLLDWGYKCSVCHVPAPDKKTYPHCPYCGAKMETAE